MQPLAPGRASLVPSAPFETHAYGFFTFQGGFSRHLPRALASGVRGLQPVVTARYSSARVGGRVAKFFFGASRRVRGREAQRGLQPGDVRSSLRQRGEVCSPATCEVLFGARRRARARRRTICSPARCSACRRGRRRGGLQVHNPASWRCVPRCVSAWAKARWPEWPAGPQPGVVAMSSSARVGEGLVAYSSISFGRPGALLGSSVAFGSGCGQALPGLPRK